MRKIIAAGLLLTLAGCITVGGMSGGVKCPPQYKWTKDFRNKLADEARGLAETAATKEALAELQELRNWINDNCK